MTETIALDTILRRRGHAHVNDTLDAILGETGWLTTGQLADLIAVDGIIGEANTRTSGPVGLWVVNDLQAHGIPAVAHTWVDGELHVYDAAIRLIGEVTIPAGHTLYQLDVERPELVWQGEADPR
ncbi:hypothetical protein [Nocardiopsis synnemataformans]|uniref:hypothetical protein n=1 Tax=Nocardiopsis synnemataformans TaxID=61305 RepID=UPI003EBDF256